MTIEVQLFAAARRLAEADRVAVELPPGATVEALRGALAEGYPGLATLLPYVRFAIADDYVRDSTVIPPGAIVALIPPVSGG